MQYQRWSLAPDKNMDNENKEIHANTYNGIVQRGREEGCWKRSASRVGIEIKCPRQDHDRLNEGRRMAP